MIEGRARVLATEGQLARLEIERPSSCSGCGASGSCGTALLGRWLSCRRSQVPAINPIDARPGDWVVVGLADQVLTQAALVTYLVPLVGLILGAGAAHSLGGEPAAILGGGVGLIAGLLGAARFARRRGADPAYRAVILRQATDLPRQVPFV